MLDYLLDPSEPFVPYTTCANCNVKFLNYEKGLEKDFYPYWLKPEHRQGGCCCSEECLEELEKEED